MQMKFDFKCSWLSVPYKSHWEKYNRFLGYNRCNNWQIRPIVDKMDDEMIIELPWYDWQVLNFWWMTSQVRLLTWVVSCKFRESYIWYEITLIFLSGINKITNMFVSFCSYLVLLGFCVCYIMFCVMVCYDMLYMFYLCCVILCYVIMLLMLCCVVLCCVV